MYMFTIYIVFYDLEKWGSTSVCLFVRPSFFILDLNKLFITSSFTLMLKFFSNLAHRNNLFIIDKSNESHGP